MTRAVFNRRIAEEAAAKPVPLMMDILRRSGRENFHEGAAWESALCALVLAFEPGCKVFRLLETLPYKYSAYGETDVLNVMGGLGYYARKIRMTIPRIDSRLYPCLFITKKGEPLVLLSDKDGEVILYRGGRLETLPKSSLPRGKGFVWLFERYDESRSPLSKFRREGSGHSWFRAITGRFKGIVGQVMLAGLMVNLLALTTPLFIMLVYDRVIAVDAIGILPMLLLGALLAIIFEWRLRHIRSKALSWLAARMDNVISNKIFTHLIGLSPKLIERASVASQIARLKTFESVRDFFSGSVFLSMLEMPFVAIAGLAIFAIAGPLVLVPLSAVLLYCLLFYIVQRRVKVVIRLAAKASSIRQQFTLETFEKIHAIRGYGLIKNWENKFRHLTGKEMLAHFHLGWLGMLAETGANALTILAAVATVGVGVHLIWAGMMSAGALVASMILVWRILTPFYSLCTMIPRLEQLRHSIIQVNKLMDMDTENMLAKARSRLPKIKGNLTFSHVALRYGDEADTIFSRLNFSLKAGEMMVITGENGAGKSSILKMIKSLYRPAEGAVQIDGFDIRQLDAPDLRRHVAYMPQSPDLFKGSILENMRLANPLATEEDIIRALVRADLWDDIEKLPSGINTAISKYHHQDMPAHFIEKFSLARLYLHDAPILLIDEIPNILFNNQGGKNLKEFIRTHKGKKTILMVSYREDMMQLADQLLVLRRAEKPVLLLPDQLNQMNAFNIPKEVA